MKRVLFLVLTLLLSGCAQNTTSVPGNADGGTAVGTLPAVSTSTPNTPTDQLLAIQLDKWEQDLVQIGLATGTKQIIFHTPENGWLASFDFWQRDGEGGKFVLAYAPPPPEGEINFGFTGLYLMSADGSALTPLLAPGVEEELFFDPAWSADGESIYYAHIEPLEVETYTFMTTLERLHVATGQMDVIAEGGIWPRMSPDGTMLAYVQVEPKTQRNALVISDPDGANVSMLVGAEQFTAVDAPVFSPDGQMLYFSAAENQTSRSWWEILTGVQVAAAHNLPSDWYRVPAAGGEPERLTEMNVAGLYGRFAPDHTPYFAFASQEGIYQMSGDGEDLQKLQEGTFTASLAWIP